MTLVSRKSFLTGEEHTMEIPVDLEKLHKWRMGLVPGVVQVAFPELDSGQREFLMTGITPDEWDTFVAPPCETCGKLKIDHRDDALAHPWMEP